MPVRLQQEKVIHCHFFRQANTSVSKCSATLKRVSICEGVNGRLTIARQNVNIQRLFLLSHVAHNYALTEALQRSSICLFFSSTYLLFSHIKPAAKEILLLVVFLAHHKRKWENLFYFFDFYFHFLSHELNDKFFCLRHVVAVISVADITNHIRCWHMEFRTKC